MSVSNATPSTVSTNATTPSISRTNILLLVLLFVQLGVVAYFFWPTEAATTSSEALLLGVTAETVTAFTITDDTARAVSFVKEGDAWTLANSDGYPARSDKITEALGKLLGITTDRLVTQTAGSHDRLQVAEGNYLRKIEITTANGTQTLYLGSSTGAAATHVRAATSDNTYLTSELATWELDTLPTTWIDVAYFSVPKEQITEVTLENAKGSYIFVRNGEDWTLADATAEEPVASANISALIDRLTTLNLHSVLGKSDSPDYGLASPLATITVASSDATTDTASAQSKTTTLVVGAKDDETNTYHLKSSDSEFYVRLAAFTGDEFVNKQRDDFMVQPPQATGEETSDMPSTTTTEPSEDAPSITSSQPENSGAVAPSQTLQISGVVTATSGSTSEEAVSATATVTQ